MTFRLGLIRWGWSLALLVMLAGCTAAPFAPIAVPIATALRPEPVVDHREEYMELTRLQLVKAKAYVISPGDTFAVIVDGEERLSRPRISVMSDGMISISPIGVVKVAGLTINSASELLTKKFEKYVRNCNVILEPLEIKPDTVTVCGTVTTPGVYPFSFGSCRLTDAIAMANGLLSVTGTSDRLTLADLDNAYIVRDGKILPVDFNKALIQGDQLNNIPLVGGDYIYIPSTENGKITVLGEVGRPNCIPYQPELTLLQAIGISGGLKETNSKDIKVIRGGMKAPMVYNIDIKKMQLGQIMDFELKPRDVVFVPRDPVSEWNVIIRQILPTVQLLNNIATPIVHALN